MESSANTTPLTEHNVQQTSEAPTFDDAQPELAYDGEDGLLNDEAWPEGEDTTTFDNEVPPEHDSSNIDPTPLPDHSFMVDGNSAVQHDVQANSGFEEQVVDDEEMGDQGDWDAEEHGHGDEEYDYNNPEGLDGDYDGEGPAHVNGYTPSHEAITTTDQPITLLPASDELGYDAPSPMVEIGPPQIRLLVKGYDTPFNLFSYSAPSLLPTLASIYDKPARDLFNALREDNLLSERFRDGSREMILSVPGLNLSLAEDNIWAKTVSMNDLVLVYSDSTLPQPATFVLEENENRFYPLFKALDEKMKIAAEYYDGPPNPHVEVSIAHDTLPGSQAVSFASPPAPAIPQAMAVNGGAHEDDNHYVETHENYDEEGAQQEYDEGGNNEYQEHEHGYDEGEDVDYEDGEMEGEGPYEGETAETLYLDEGDEGNDQVYPETGGEEQGEVASGQITFVNGDVHASDPAELDDSINVRQDADARQEENSQTDPPPAADLASTLLQESAEDAGIHHADDGAEDAFDGQEQQEENHEFYENAEGDYDGVGEDDPAAYNEDYTGEEYPEEGTGEIQGDGNRDQQYHDNYGEYDENDQQYVGEEETYGDDQEGADPTSYGENNEDLIEGDAEGQPADDAVHATDAVLQLDVESDFLQGPTTIDFDHLSELQPPPAIDFDALGDYPVMPSGVDWEAMLSSPPAIMSFSPLPTPQSSHISSQAYRTTELPPSPTLLAAKGRGSALSTSKSGTKRAWDEANEATDYASEVGEIGATLPVDTHKRLRVL